MNKLELHWPVSTPCVVTQAFGVNKEYYQANDIDILGHNGNDILTYHGQPVYATHDGFAAYETDSKQGHGVVVRSKEQALIFGKPSYYKTIHWHFCNPANEPKYKSPIPNDGKEHEVKMGDLLGYADNTGLSTGDHLHFALKPIEFKNNFWRNTRQNNGYGGCIDPAFYMSTFSAQDMIRAQTQVAEAESILTHIQELPVVDRAKPLFSLGELIKNLLKWINK